MMWMVVFFLVGLAFIMAEFFLPGAVCGVMGVLSLVASAAVGISNYPDYVALIIGAEIMGALACVVAGFLLLAKTRAGKRLLLETAQKPEEGWVSVVTDTSLMGAVGVVMTQLRPAGTIDVNGKRVDAVSDGTFIDQGARVRVKEVHGSRVVVETVE